MTSPRGLPFIVCCCVRYSNTHLMITGYDSPQYPDSKWILGHGLALDGEEKHECNWIQQGFLYPEIGWTVHDVPELSPMPELTYREQIVLPPMNA